MAASIRRQSVNFLRDSEELLHLWLRLCPASPTNEIVFVGNSSVVCESFMSIVRILWLCKKTTLLHNSARFRGITSFMVASVFSLTHKWNNCCRQFVDSLWIFLDHSQNNFDYFDCVKKLHFQTLLRDSAELLHLWFRLCPASHTNEINFVGNSSAVCESCMSIVRIIWLCKKITLSQNSARFNGVTSFMVESVSSLAHKWNNFRLQFVGSLWIIHEHSMNIWTV